MTTDEGFVTIPPEMKDTVIEIEDREIKQDDGTIFSSATISRASIDKLIRNLPPPEEGTIYITSAEICLKVEGRSDLFFPIGMNAVGITIVTQIGSFKDDN